MVTMSNLKVKEKAKEISNIEISLISSCYLKKGETEMSKVSKMRVRKSRKRIASNKIVKTKVLKILDKATDWLTTRQVCNLFHGLPSDDEGFTTEEVDSFLQNVLYSFKVGTLTKGYSGISCVWAVPKHIKETSDGYDFITPKSE